MSYIQKIVKYGRGTFLVTVFAAFLLVAPASAAVCTWQEVSLPDLNNYTAVRSCNEVAPGKTACDNDDNASCGGVPYISPECLNSAGSVSLDAVGSTCYSSATKTVSSTFIGTTAEPGVCYAKLLETVCVADPTGTINVSSNNIPSSWTITGQATLPATPPGTGTSASYPSQPTGTYSITWNSVPDYVTPPPQSLTLTDGGIILFSGNYTPSPVVNLWFSFLNNIKSFFAESVFAWGGE